MEEEERQWEEEKLRSGERGGRGGMIGENNHDDYCGEHMQGWRRTELEVMVG